MIQTHHPHFSRRLLVMLGLGGLLAMPACLSDLKTGTDSGGGSSMVPKDDATAPGPGEPNTIRILDVDGSGFKDKPFLVSQLFRPGEIRDFPVARMDGKSLPSQANVRTRWEDGSVRHAMVAFTASVPAGGAALVDFWNRPSCGCDVAEAVTLDQLRDGSYDLGLNVEITSDRLPGGSQSYDLAKIIGGLTSIDPSPLGMETRYWATGPIATQVIVEDRSPALSLDATILDAAKNPYKAFNLHPIFILTLFPATHQVRVEVVLENSSTNDRIDIPYAVTLRHGSTTLYQNSAFTHKAHTRWRKSYWFGGEGGSFSVQPQNVFIDHNLPHLISTGAVPNFDMQYKLSSDIIRKAYEEYPDVTQCSPVSWKAIEEDPANAALNDIGGKRQWCAQMDSPGGRPDIGVIPSWYVRFLYAMGSNDPLAPRLFRQVMGNAEAAGTLGVYWRENKYPDRLYMSGRKELAWSRFVSLTSRPTISLQQAPDALEADSVGGVAEVGYDWAELAHIPAMAYIPYLLTGDYYHYEAVQAAGSWALAHRAIFDRYRFRNTAVAGIVRDEYRGQAWALRDIAQAWAVTLDEAPEKEYFRSRFEINVAARMGRMGIKEGPLYQPTCSTQPVDRDTETNAWCYGASVRWEVPDTKEAAPEFAPDVNPMGIPYTDPIAPNIGSIDLNKADRLFSTWMLSYMITSLGHAERLGLPSGPLARNFAKPLGLILLSSYPKMAGGYYLAAGLGGQLFKTPQEMHDAFVAGQYDQIQPINFSDSQSGYFTLVRAAMTYAAKTSWTTPSGSVDGAMAWGVLSPVATDAFHDNPTWAYAP